MAEVWSLGTLGLESAQARAGGSELLVYFACPPEDAVDELIDGRRVLAGAELVDVAEVSTDDWQRQYRSRSMPFAVGRDWWVDPREPHLPSPEPPGQRRLLLIPARTAFGTGSHASTSLIVELMEDVDLADKRVLDVGTGSGILAMVALASGAKSVTAIDIDPVATFVALQTCRLNDLQPHLLTGGLAAIRIHPPSEPFDVIVANVLPSRLQSDYASLAELLHPAGVLLLSGLLLEQQSKVLSAMTGLGWRYKSHRDREEWVALHLERAFP